MVVVVVVVVVVMVVMVVGQDRPEIRCSVDAAGTGKREELYPSPPPHPTARPLVL